MNSKDLRSLAAALSTVALTHCGGAPTNGPLDPSVPAASTESAPANVVAPSAPTPTAEAPAANKPADSPFGVAAAPKVATKAADAPSSPSSPSSSGSSKTPPKPVEAPITSVRVYVTNGCAKKVEYCVENGSTLNTSLGSNTSTTHTVSPGAKFKIKNGNSCGSVVFTAPAAKDEQKFNICSR